MRPRRKIPCPETGRLIDVAGVSFHEPSGRYRIRFLERGKERTQYFPRSVKGLAEAKAAAANKGLVSAPVTMADLPAWVDPPMKVAPRGATATPGLRISIKEIGEVYRAYYLSERGFEVPSKGNDTLKGAPRIVRQQFNEHVKYFGEFEIYCKEKEILFADQINEDTFSGYRTVVNVAAGRQNIGNQSLWINVRYRAVLKAFRRAISEKSDRAYPTMLVNPKVGYLSQLTMKETAPISTTEKIKVENFKALVNVADCQWKAILMLSLNCALTNTDVALIEWKHVDLDSGVMDFPRPKNGRLRRTPLAAEVVDTLRDWKRATPSVRPEIFLTDNGTSWVGGTNGVSKHFTLLCYAAGLKKDPDADKPKGIKWKKKPREEWKKTGRQAGSSGLCFSQLRKTGPTLAVETGVPNAELTGKLLLGHMPHGAWKHYAGITPPSLTPLVAEIAKRYFR